MSKRAAAILAAAMVACAVSPQAFGQVEGGVSGADAMVAKGDYQGALEAYQPVLQSEPKNVAALVGSARAYAGLNQMPKAVAALEKALQVAPGDRVVVHNLALALFKTDNQPRGFKILRDYLQSNAKTADEPLLNELLYMLGNASDATKKTKPYLDAQATAEQYAKSLEAQRPGFKRWGAQWTDAPIVEEHIASNKALQKDIDKLDARIKDDTKSLADAEKNTAIIRDRVSKGWDDQYKLDRQLDTLRRIKEERQLKLDDRDKMLERMAKPSDVPEPGTLAFGTPAPELTHPVPTPPPAPPVVPDGSTTTNPPNRPLRRPRPVRPPVQPVEPAEPEPGPMPQPPEVKPVPKTVSVYGVGFAIAQDTVVVSADVVKDATEIVLQSPNGTSDDGTVIRADATTGLALVKLKKLKAVSLSLAPKFEGGAVQCVALPSIDLFRSDATLIDGKAPAPGEKWTISLSKHPKLIGAPLVSGGKVVGVTLAPRDADAGAIPAVTLDQLTKFIGSDTGTRGTAATDPKQAIFQVVVTKQEAK